MPFAAAVADHDNRHICGLRDRFCAGEVATIVVCHSHIRIDAVLETSQGRHGIERHNRRATTAACLRLSRPRVAAYESNRVQAGGIQGQQTTSILEQYRSLFSQLPCCDAVYLFLRSRNGLSNRRMIPKAHLHSETEAADELVIDDRYGHLARLHSGRETAPKKFAG